MIETSTDQRPSARWFWSASVAILLFELFGAASILSELTLDPATLPPEQRAISLSLPAWMKVASVVAVSTGVCGAIGLLLRRRWAPGVFLVSLLAVVVQDSAYVLHRPLGDSISPGDLLIPAVILILCAAIFGFASNSRRRGLLV